MAQPFVRPRQTFLVVSLCGVACLAETFPHLPRLHVSSDSVLPCQPGSSSEALPLHLHFNNYHSRTHVHARTYTHIHTAEPFRLALCDGSVHNHDGPFRWRQWASPFHSNKHLRGQSGFPRFCVFSHIKKLLGRTEARTCDMMCFQTIRTV